jgi:tetratricopeptide (TPR) repeat protein
LNANSDLIDADLLLIMARVSVLEMRRNQNLASKLQDLVSQLSSVVGNSSVQSQIEADKLLVQGEKQAQSSQFKDALQSFQQALSIYQTIGDSWGKGAVLGDLGFVYNALGDYVKELECHQQALKLRWKLAIVKGMALFRQSRTGLSSSRRLQ